MALLIFDLFDGDDGDPWDPEIWPLFREPRNPSPTPELLSNQGRMTSANTTQCWQFMFTEPTLANLDFSIYYTPDPDDMDMFLEIGYRLTANVTSGGHDPGLGYNLRWHPSGNAVRLYTVDAETNYTVIGFNNSPGIATADQRAFRVRVDGDRHLVKWWKVADGELPGWQMDVTDATYSAAGRSCVVMRNGTDHVNFVDWDHLRLEEVVPPSASIRVGSDTREIVGLYVGNQPVQALFYGDIEIPIPESAPPEPPPTLDGFPTATSVGVEAANPGWTPTTTETSDVEVTVASTVIEDTLFDGANLFVHAANVTVRNCEFVNGDIINVDGSTIHAGLVVEDCTFRADPPGTYMPHAACITGSGWTATRCLCVDCTEGFSTEFALGTGGDIAITDCYVWIQHPTPCEDWHGDGIQTLGSYDVGTITVTNSVFGTDPTVDDCGGSSCIDFFEGTMGHGVLNGVIMSGAAWSLRQSAPCDVNGLYVVDGSWDFGPVTSDNPGSIGDWNDAYTCDLDGSGQPIPASFVAIERPT